jgi:hypothetical protein
MSRYDRFTCNPSPTGVFSKPLALNCDIPAIQDLDLAHLHFFCGVAADSDQRCQ